MTQTTRKVVASLGTLALVGALVACGGNDKASTTDAQHKQQQDTLTAFQQQSQNVPYPKDKIKDPQERHNLGERLVRQNDPNHVSYLYILSFAKPLGYYVIKGKVSSTQSQMTSSQYELDHGSYGQSVVDAPGDDGSYGPNEPGIFFFTTAGVMVQTDLNYVISDQPIPFGDLKLPKLG